MVEAVAVTQTITSPNEVRSKLNLNLTADPLFFREWHQDLLEISDVEKAGSDRLKNRYLYYSADGVISEGTVTLLWLLHS